LASAVAGLELVPVVGFEERAWRLLVVVAAGSGAGRKELSLVVHLRADMALWNGE
jgi:hypothetical protein